MSLVYSCSNKEDEELMMESVVENNETSSNQTLSTGTCSSSCMFSSCQTSCEAGKTPYCECDWGFASCGCRSGEGNDKVGLMPSYSMEMLSATISYRSFLANSGYEAIANLVDAIKDDLVEGNTEGYYSNVEVYVAAIESLSVSQQNEIRGWLDSH